MGLCLMDLLRRKNSHLYSGRSFLPVYFPWSVQPSCILPSQLTDCHYFSVCWFSNRKNDLILKGLPINLFLNFSLAQEKRPLQYFFIVSVQQKSRTKVRKQSLKSIERANSLLMKLQWNNLIQHKNLVLSPCFLLWWNTGTINVLNISGSSNNAMSIQQDSRWRFWTRK